MSRAMVEFDDLTSLHEKIKQLPNLAEMAINEVLHTQGIEIVTNEMTNLMPKSKVNKKHAKDSKWSTSEEHNLGFVVKTRGGAAKNKNSYGYLVFPDEGRGPSNPWQQNFSIRAAQLAGPIILDKLHGTLDELLEI